MQGYLKKIFELDTTEEWGMVESPSVKRGRGRGRGGMNNGNEIFHRMTDKETKELIEKKLKPMKSDRKRKRGEQEPPNGMTREEMIAEQQRLFDNARNYKASDDEEQEQYGDEVMSNNFQ